MAKKEDKTLLILTHILGMIVGFLAPLIILLVSDNKDVKRHSKIALNWQFSFLIYIVISFILVIVLIGFLLIPTLIILNIVFSIMAAVKASENEFWRYPLSIQFFRV